jgi:multiple sugar transport system permease protein
MKESSGIALRYLGPSLILIGLFFVVPILDSFRLSFFRLILTFPWLGQKFVGLENYQDLFTDPIAFKSLMTTVVFVAVTTSLEVTLGLGIALVLNEWFRGRGLLRALVLVPWAIPTVVSSQMWRFIFNDQYGVLNIFLFGTMKESYLAPLADPFLAPVAIMIAEVWKTTSFAALIILAGLQSIPEDLYEAGSIDGMTSWQRFRHITLPLVKPALLLALLFRTIDALRVFDLVFVMTQGGPADATNVIQYYGYKKIFAEGMVGYGSAVAVGIFLVSLLLSLFYIRTLGARLLESGGK